MSLSSHIKIIARKQRINYTIPIKAEGIYVAGTLAGWRSQLLLQRAVAPQ
jgi:hypothetical protein